MNAMIFLWLVVSIAIILFTILKLKLNPTISLILGSIFMGLACGLGPQATVSAITSGFGNLMTGIGLSVGFGVILGQLLSDSNGAKVIATTMVSATSEKYALYALGITGFILSVPVFYDVTFVILIPLAIAVPRQIRKPLPYTAGAIIIGAGAAHTLVPPTPNPLAAAEILNFDLGIMVIVGLILGLVSSVIAIKIYTVLLDKGMWNSKQDETGIEVYEETKSGKEENQPSFFMSLLPVILPVVLILIGTVVGAVMEETPGWISFISNKSIALLIAFVIAAIFRIALGSGTVASITTMTIMASVPAAVGMHPVWLAIACLSGSLSCGHVNDSGFWVSANLAGFTITGGLKSYTLGNAITAVFAMLFAVVGCLVIPL